MLGWFGLVWVGLFGMDFLGLVFDLGLFWVRLDSVWVLVMFRFWLC
jgi:hypothetical protein